MNFFDYEQLFFRSLNAHDLYSRMIMIMIISKLKFYRTKPMMHNTADTNLTEYCNTLRVIGWAAVICFSISTARA